MARIPPRDTTAGRVFNDLRNLARRQARNTEELLVAYTLERWLYRLSISAYADIFLLKGEMLLAALGARRATRDADLLIQGIAADQPTVTSYVVDVAAITVDDGVIFHTDKAKNRTIREGEHYTGTRVIIPAAIAKATTKLSLDINIGDPVTPGAVVTDYPQLLATETFSLRTYPIETVLAEKITAAINLGAENTRERDYADIWRLATQHRLDSGKVKTALAWTATWQGISPRPLAELVDELVSRRQTAYTDG